VPGEAILWSILRRMVELTWIVAAVVLMLKAYSGERYRVPVAAGNADRAARTKDEDLPAARYSTQQRCS
jgi:uncharacterized membrane protein